MGWICTTLRSELPSHPPPLHPFALQSVFLMWQEHVCAPACLLHWICIYVCQLYKQWGRPLPWEQQVSHSVDGWSSADCSHVSMCLSMCMRLCAGWKKTEGGMQERWRQGELSEQSFKKLIFFLWHSNKEGNQRAVLFSSCGFIFPVNHEQSLAKEHLQMANLCLSDSLRVKRIILVVCKQDKSSVYEQSC